MIFVELLVIHDSYAVYTPVCTDLGITTKVFFGKGLYTATNAPLFVGLPSLLPLDDMNMNNIWLHDFGLSSICMEFSILVTLLCL